MNDLVLNHYIYFKGSPFCFCVDRGSFGFSAFYFSSSGLLSHFVSYSSFLDFCDFHSCYLSSLSLGPPFPVNSSPLDVK